MWLLIGSIWCVMVVVGVIAAFYGISRWTSRRNGGA